MRVAQRADLHEARDPGTARRVGLEHVDGARLDHATEVVQIVAVLTGRNLQGGRRTIAQQSQTRAGNGRHTCSRTVSERTVSAILVRFGCPFRSDSANLAACSTVTFGGIGGVKGSTTASTITGPSVAIA